MPTRRRTEPALPPAAPDRNTDPDTDRDPRSVAEPEAGSDTEPDSGPNTGSHTGPDTGPDTPRRRTITDAADLKAIAHPLRLALLEVLTIHGAMTATQLAARLGESPSNCSWHLRKLAEHGFVTEVEGVKGRSRPWQRTSEGMSWGRGDTALEPETSAAGHALTDVLLGRELHRLRAARRAESQEPPEWREASTVVQSALWLTAQEAREVAEQLEALFLTHQERLRHPERRPEQARLVALVGWLTPWHNDEPGTGDEATRAGAEPETRAGDEPGGGAEPGTVDGDGDEHPGGGRPGRQRRQRRLGQQEDQR